jgi:hypothetical protein
MKPRVLAVDDETSWLEDFRAWIPEDIAIQDSAAHHHGSYQAASEIPI